MINDIPWYDRIFFSFPPVFSGFPGFFGSFSLIVKICVFSIQRRIFSITETHLLLKRIFIRIFNRFFPVLINNYGFFSNICINRIEPEKNIKYFVRLTTLTGFPGFPVFPVFPVFPGFLISPCFFPFNQLVGFTNTFNNLINQIFTRFFPVFSVSPVFRFLPMFSV